MRKIFVAFLLVLLITSIVSGQEFVRRERAFRDQNLFGMGDEDFLIGINTSEGSDTRKLSLWPADAIATTRGGGIQLFGDDHATPGRVQITTGAGAADMDINIQNTSQEANFQFGGSDKFRVSQTAVYPTAVTVLLGKDSTSQAFGGVYLSDGTIKAAARFDSGFKFGTITSSSWDLVRSGNTVASIGSSGFGMANTKDLYSATNGGSDVGKDGNAFGELHLTDGTIKGTAEFDGTNFEIGTRTGHNVEIVANGNAAMLFGGSSVTLYSGKTLNASSGVLEIPNGTTLPATCDAGDLFQDTDSDDCADTASGDGALCLCKSSNTWALIQNI